MSVTANISAAGVFSVTNWTPPPIQSLNFTTDCDLVRDFYSSWFQKLLDFDPKEDKFALYNLPFSDRPASFFVADSLDAQTTEAYFRNALPENLRNVPSYGQVLDWELALRKNFSKSLPRLAELTFPPDAGPIDWFLNNTYSTPYFQRVLRDPGLVCQRQACSGFEWNRLIDVNGPGVAIVYWGQVMSLAIASMLVICELWQTRRREIQQQPQPLHPAYRCFRRTIESVIQGSVFFFAAAPLAMFVDFQWKGPHFFPPNDQNTALVMSSLSVVMLFWSWRINRCFAVIDMVKGGNSPVGSHLSLLPLACLLVAVPFVGFMLHVRAQTAAINPRDLPAFDVDGMAVLICRGIGVHLGVYEEVNTPGRLNVNPVFIATRLVITVMCYAAFRLLWDDLAIRSAVLRLSPWFRLRWFYAPVVNQALAGRHPKHLNRRELDVAAANIFENPRTSAHIWHLGYGELLGAAAACFYIIIALNPWKSQEFEWSQQGKPWNLGQILALITLAPPLVEFLTSFGESLSPAKNFFF